MRDGARASDKESRPPPLGLSNLSVYAKSGRGQYAEEFRRDRDLESALKWCERKGKKK